MKMSQWGHLDRNLAFLARDPGHSSLVRIDLRSGRPSATYCFIHPERSYSGRIPGPHHVPGYMWGGEKKKRSYIQVNQAGSYYGTEASGWAGDLTFCYCKVPKIWPAL